MDTETPLCGDCDGTRPRSIGSARAAANVRANLDPFRPVLDDVSISADTRFGAKDRRGVPRSLKVTGGIVAALLLLGVGAAIADNGNGGKTALSTKTAAGTSSDDDSATQESSEPEATPIVAHTANPDGTFTNSCEYVLGNFTSNTKQGYRFIGQAELKNTGNVSIVADVSAKWVQVGSRAVKRTKRVTVDWQQSETVNFTVPVSQDQIDLIQAYNGDEDCQVSVKIVDTVGDAHPE